jgi:outer membrane protein TolC
VALSGTWGFDRNGGIEYSSNDQASGGAIELRWDLFTGGSREAKVRFAESVAAEASAQLRRASLAVESQVRQAVVALADAQGQIRLQRENLKTALDSRRMIQAGYLAGREALTRLNQAQRDVLEADASLSLARIRLRRAWSDLHSAASAYPPELIDGTSTDRP